MLIPMHPVTCSPRIDFTLAVLQDCLLASTIFTAAQPSSQLHPTEARGFALFKHKMAASRASRQPLLGYMITDERWGDGC